MDQDTLYENEHLSQIKEMAIKELDLLRDEAENTASDILSAKRELQEEGSHSISNLSDPDNFEQLVELSQFATLVSDTITKHETIVKQIGQLERMIQSPYFARIDFRFPDEKEDSPVYIGRFSLWDDYTAMVHDWRSPIASMFYQFGLGDAYYEAPAGRITGTISLKRQYEIKNGILEYFFDASIEILDEFLRKLLSQNASTQMKSVVETIQRDQYVVIRDTENDVLMVQGVAGSGKTSIALHRVAYLMYKGLDDSLSNHHIIIISPNQLFERYISNVLPDLGEENTTSYLLDELFKAILKTRKIQTRYQFLERIISENDKSWVSVMKRSMEYKASEAFVQVLDKLSLPEADFNHVLEAYKKIFEDSAYFYELAKDVPCPAGIEDILRFTRGNLQSSSLFYDDAAALSYLYIKHCEYDEFRHIRQVVIDEAQDYYFLHFKILNLLFPNTRYTILGDINQTIEKSENLSFYEKIKDVIKRKKSAIVTLDKSFRCTKEILQFGAQLIGSEVKAFGRKGEMPGIYKLNAEDDLETLLNEIELCKEEGFRSICILCKSGKNSSALHKGLRKKTDVSLIKSESNVDLAGTFILPIYLSKGLEFDAVIIWDVDVTHYSTEDDRKLLYIACTRALHRLSLFYTGTLSPLLSF